MTMRSTHFTHLGIVHIVVVSAIAQYASGKPDSDTSLMDLRNSLVFEVVYVSRDARKHICQVEKPRKIRVRSRLESVCASGSRRRGS